MTDLDRLDALYEQTKDGWTDGDTWYLWWPEWVLAIGEAYPELRDELVRLRTEVQGFRTYDEQNAVIMNKDWHEIQKLKAENTKLLRRLEL